MGIIDKLFGSGVEGAATGIATLVKEVGGQIHLSPEAQAELELKLDANKVELAQTNSDLEAKLNASASANIVSDSSSVDWVVRRARPSFIWVMSTAIAFNLLVFPLVSLASGHGLKPIDIPPRYLDIFEFAYGGYAGLRTAEKLLKRS
jgi:hypothetical protein